MVSLLLLVALVLANPLGSGVSWLLVSPGFRKIIGDGESTSVLCDPWLFDIPICLKPTFINSDSISNDLLVCDLILHRLWNSEIFDSLFGRLLACRIFSVQLFSSPRMIAGSGPLMRVVTQALPVYTSTSAALPLTRTSIGWIGTISGSSEFRPW